MGEEKKVLLDIISFKSNEAISYCPELPKFIFMESNP